MEQGYEQTEDSEASMDESFAQKESKVESILDFPAHNTGPNVQVDYKHVQSVMDVADEAEVCKLIVKPLHSWSHFTTSQCLSYLRDYILSTSIKLNSIWGLL